MAAKKEEVSKEKALEQAIGKISKEVWRRFYNEIRK